ncbi:hypothetical protein ACFLX8_01485 [Chloroflexota bacterium]
MFKWLGQRAEKSKQKTRQLWESEFNVVKEGLDEEQVVDFVNSLIDQHKTLQQTSADSLRSLLKTAVTDAEQMAASIKLRAQAEAEAEAARIITQAKQEDQEIKKKAEIAAQREAEDIVAVANKEAELTGVEAKQRALLFLLMAREEIEKEVREEYKRAYARLSSSLQNLLSEGQNIEVELKDKRAQLWESKSFELKEPEAVLLRTSEEVMPPLETLVSEEEIEQPAQLQEEAVGEETEQPAQLQEEAVEEETEQPAQLQEEAVEEETEQPAQLQEEAVEEETEQPAQLQGEAVEEETEELVEQRTLEEISGREETDSIQLKPGDSQTLYTGEVELVIAMPVELKMVSKLYNYLQTIPDIKILRTTGSWDRGTTITVVADKPIPLISKLTEIPDVEVTPGLLQGDSSAKGTSSSLRRVGGKGAQRIQLTLKEAQPL